MLPVKKRISMSYNEMRYIGQKHYNDTGFCACVAVASAAQVRFGKARSVLMNKELHGDAARQHRYGGHWDTIYRSLDLLGVRVVDAPRWESGQLSKIDYRHEWFGLTLVSLENAKPKGTYLLFTDAHVTFMKDGVINDWSSKRDRKERGYRTGSMKKVLLVWKLEREFEEVPDTMLDAPL